ncbi:hypothetical protein Tco_1328801 [Tanacetum coccineum]
MVISSPCLTDIKNWLVQKQTAFGKDFSNPFTADSLLKTIWFSTHHALHAPCYSNEALAIPEQTTIGKEISILFMAEDVLSWLLVEGKYDAITVGELQHVVVVELMDVGIAVKDLEYIVDEPFVNVVENTEEYYTELDYEGKVV